MKRLQKRTAKYKAKVALQALSKLNTVTQLSSKYQIHHSLISRWRAKIETEAESLFNSNNQKVIRDKEEIIEELYKQIGQLKVELDWLKKKSNFIS